MASMSPLVCGAPGYVSKLWWFAFAGGVVYGLTKRQSLSAKVRERGGGREGGSKCSIYRIHCKQHTNKHTHTLET